jgi:ParB-like chromosome segregation protein Spo0J
MKLSDIKANPDNPRVIKDEAFNRLVQSIKDFPKMMALRPMVVDDNLTVLGGNMRLRALRHLGYKDIPDEWVKRASDLTEEEKKQFIIKDNVSVGDWDWDTLANEWDVEELEDWGLDIPNFEIDEEKEQIDLSDQLKETFEVIISAIDEKQQEQIYNKLIGEGYQCRVLTL